MFTLLYFTDRQTDRQTTCDRKTALCAIVHRAVIILYVSYGSSCVGLADMRALPPRVSAAATVSDSVVSSMEFRRRTVNFLMTATDFTPCLSCRSTA